MKQPISDTEMRVVLAEEVARLDDLSRPTWKQYKTKMSAVPIERDGVRGEAFIVARHEDQVVLFDDRVDQFGTGRLESDGVLRKWENYGEPLAWTLRHFPR